MLANFRAGGSLQRSEALLVAAVVPPQVSARPAPTGNTIASGKTDSILVM
jgi:hypothetical protein